MWENTPSNLHKFLPSVVLTHNISLLRERFKKEINNLSSFTVAANSSSSAVMDNTSQTHSVFLHATESEMTQ